MAPQEIRKDGSRRLEDSIGFVMYYYSDCTRREKKVKSEAVVFIHVKDAVPFIWDLYPFKRDFAELLRATKKERKDVNVFRISIIFNLPS